MRIILHNCDTEGHFVDAKRTIQAMFDYGPDQQFMGTRFSEDSSRCYFAKKNKGSISVWRNES